MMRARFHRPHTLLQSLYMPDFESDSGATAAFSALGLSPPLLRAIRDSDYQRPTPVQSQAIPLVLQGRDLLAEAQTGSGKTAAYALPMLQALSLAPRSAERAVRALVLVPTRELAMQVSDAIRQYARFLPEHPKVLCVFGGVSINPQMLALRGGAEVVVATPGRLLDLLDHNALHLSAVQLLVLDEADRLFDLGFADELQRILLLLPARRQNLLFSATFPAEVQVLASVLLTAPVRVAIAASEHTTPDIQQRAIAVDTPRRTQLLRHLLQSESWSRVLVFVATQYATEHVADKLRRVGIQAAAFNGELSQGARTQVLADFKASRVQVLVATDVAARGIDIVQLPAVVNYDLPRSAVEYTHRIGRTGRAGESGVAVSFVTPEAEAHFRLIEKRHQLRLPREVIAGFEPALEMDVAMDETSSTTAARTASDPNGGIKGRRKSKKDKLREAAASGAAPASDAGSVAASASDVRQKPLRGADIWQQRKPKF